MCSQNFVLIGKGLNQKIVFYRVWHKKVSPLAGHFLCLTLQKTIFQSLPFHIWTQFGKQIAKNFCWTRIPKSFITFTKSLQITDYSIVKKSLKILPLPPRILHGSLGKLLECLELVLSCGWFYCTESRKNPQLVLDLSIVKVGRLLFKISSNLSQNSPITCLW